MVLHHPSSPVQADVALSGNGGAAPNGVLTRACGCARDTSCRGVTTSGVYRIDVKKNHQTMDGAATVHTEFAASSSIPSFLVYSTCRLYTATVLTISRPQTLT